MSARIARSIGGRPGRPVLRYVHFRFTSSRCQRRKGRRGDEEGDPAVTRDNPARRREEDPVDGPKLERARRPLQHPELMAEDEDLEILGSVGSTRLISAHEETDEGTGDEVEERPHRPIVPGLSERESGFLTPTGG